MSAKKFEISVPWDNPKIPDYRTFALGKWRLRKTPGHLCHGYWAPMMNQPPGYLLERKTAGKWKVWMSLTTMELQSHQPHIAAAYGNVIVAGLGMGMYLHNIIQKGEVERVLVLEKDQQVIDMFDRITDWRNWPGAAKIMIACQDAKTFVLSAQSPCDFLYVDIWETIGSEAAHIDVQGMLRRIGPSSVGYWGQEFDFVTYLQQQGISASAPTQQHYWDFCKFVGLPLCEQGNPSYHKFAVAAVGIQAAQSLRNRDPATAHRLEVASLRILGAFDNLEVVDLPAA